MTDTVADVPEVLLDTWRAYELHPDMTSAADAAGVPRATFKRRLHDLYVLLGVRSSQQAGRALRERGII